MTNNKKKDGLTIITTHINADFDALASMLAAQKLYPESIVVFPGSNEKNLRDLYVNSMSYKCNAADIKDINFQEIKKLVLVDTRRRNRIGAFSTLADKQDIEIHIYDHHPRRADDIVSHYDVYEPTGANVTILTQIIQEKEINISPEEATTMCIGIYEDTGSFTFSSTTEKDLNAAAFLLSKGANINTVSDMISREIDHQQINLLNDMINSAANHKINGVDIVITTVSIDTYMQDFAFLVHKMQKMESINAIFAIVRMDNKIYIVARSRITEVDAGGILIPLGGGGHPYAGAATIKDKTLAQTEYQLIKILNEKIKPSRRAKDIMSSPPITIKPDISIKEAGHILTRYNINALLVTESTNKNDKLLGFISRQIIEKAMFHKLYNIPVQEYMTTEIASVKPDTDLLEIQDKIIDHNQRILPVIEKNKIMGVITRTNLLNILIHQYQNKSKKALAPLKGVTHARTRNVLKFMRERLSHHTMEILKSIGEVANDLGFNAYVVGGFVRDLFLYRENEDIDIVIEGDGISFAKKYSNIVKGRVHCHEKFGTAVIIFPDGFKIDIASARMEYYKFPAALPVVEMSSIKLDLFRRDFTINTLSIQLAPENFGTLIDFFSALRDIKDKAIRILHNLSFVEDPTRVFRAIRFEQRFGFTIGKLTSGLIENAVKMDFFKKLSGKRVFAELRQIFKEENPTPAIIRLNNYDLLKFIHPSLKLDKKVIEILNSVKKVLTWHDLLFLEESYMKWAVYFLALISHCDKKTSEEICINLKLAQRYKLLFCENRFEADKSLSWIEQNMPLENSTLYKKLSGIKTELILYMMGSTKKEQLKRLISLYFTQLRQTKILIKGNDLIKLGVEPGPVFSKIMGEVLNARLNGRLKTKKDEIDYAIELIST